MVVPSKLGIECFNLSYELRKCKECSCSRCTMNGTSACYIEVAIRELSRYEQAMDTLKHETTTEKENN